MDSTKQKILSYFWELFLEILLNDNTLISVQSAE